MVCPKCKKENEDNASKCIYCGEDLNEAQSNKKESDKKFIIKAVTTITILLAIIAFLILGFIAVQSTDFNKPDDDYTSSFVTSSESSQTQTSGGYDEYLITINTANSAMDAGEYDEAIESYKDAITIDPNQSTAYIGLANAYELTGEHDSAVNTLQDEYNKSGNQSIKKRLDQLNNE